MLNTSQEEPGRSRHYKRPSQASDYLKDTWGIKHTTTTLATKRSRGGGPRFHKAGPAILYEDSDLDKYAQALLGEAVSSTSELRRSTIKTPERQGIQRNSPSHEEGAA